MKDSYKKIYQQVSFTAVFKVITLFLNFALTSLLINYLGMENFGVYVAFTSLFAWMFLFDLGIAKGMRNYVTIAISQNNLKEAQSYISTTYFSVFFLSVSFCMLVVFFISNIDLQLYFELSESNSYIKKILVFLIVGFFLKFFFSIVDQLNYATHQSQYVSLNVFLVAFINVIAISGLILLDIEQSILIAVIIFSISLTTPYILSTVIFFNNKQMLRPSLGHFSKTKFYAVFNKGSKILFIQIGFLVFVGLDRLLLLKYGSAIEVSKYEIIYKVMAILVFPVSIATAPLWSSFTNAFEIKDIDWIKKIFKKFYILMFLISIFSIFLIFFFNDITTLWIGEFPDITIIQATVVAILMLCIIWGSFHTDLLLSTNHFKYITYMIAIGCVLKFLVIFVSIQSPNSQLTMVDLAFSSISAYFLFNITAPFYIRRLLSFRGNI
ncbi:hypothetical protein [Vibrio splendidus]|uniref:hypothetical protein n=1 Tax=Vibrio splendidus TaxID=29497 RepID=UPI0024694B75|nr:hypothetical protein [Vibrio splendidus]MDH5896584.1 hypothetical protein [Vibrio splendidus]